MKILRLISNLAARGFYTWAVREMCPSHPDMPRIVLRQHELKQEADALFR